MPNNCSIIIWRTTWLLPFTLSIFLNQPSSIVSTKLTAFYNSKSSKPNRSASPFGQRIKKLLLTLKTLIKALYFAHWHHLPLAILLLKIFFLAAKMSLLVLPPIKAIIPLPCHVSPVPLLLLLCRLFLLCFLWPITWRMTFSRFSGLFWILDLLLLFRLLHQLFNSTKTLVKSH